MGGMVRSKKEQELLLGTLDILILQTLVVGAAHGHTIAHVIEHRSDDVLQIQQGSLYPALHRLEDRGWVCSYWGVSENNRKARFLKTGSRASRGAHHRAQNVLVMGQMALTVVLLAGAGLLFRTIRDLWRVNPGFEAKNAITFKVGLSPSVTRSASTMHTAYHQFLERIRSIPGVESADITSMVPLNQHNNLAPFWVGTKATTAVAEAPRLFISGQARITSRP
jgi:PadR family transcriptional regulator PadR